jgi:hypothetical protein
LVTAVSKPLNCKFKLQSAEPVATVQLAALCIIRTAYRLQKNACGAKANSHCQEWQLFSARNEGTGLDRLVHMLSVRRFQPPKPLNGLGLNLYWRSTVNILHFYLFILRSVPMLLYTTLISLNVHLLFGIDCFKGMSTQGIWPVATTLVLSQIVDREQHH